MITRDCLRRGIFRSAPDLAHKIMTYIRLYNRQRPALPLDLSKSAETNPCFAYFSYRTLVSIRPAGLRREFVALSVRQSDS
jgi:hypothetical protein